MGRTTVVTDVLKGLTTTNTYAWDATVSVSGPPDFNGVASGAAITGVVGVTLPSVYKVTTAATAQPTVTAYFDRLGRTIHTLKDGFNGQQIVTDTAYNNLGQQIATSLPYLSGGTPLWTKTNYDPLGRVADVTAPNGTVTANTYIGRATQVSVDAPDLGGVNPPAQVNSTLVDAKGHTVKVWNADNVPTFTDSSGTTTTTPSIAFTLDGFGRMRVTTLKDQTQTITASYDTLGHQTQLADPDKGTWNYTNSALGQVLSQTDAATNATSSTFDQLGRPLTRTTTGNGSTETANFYYYDTFTVTTALQHTVATGTQGWIGAPEREECTATGDSSPTTNLHYYDTKGRPSMDLAQTDGKWFYTYSDYDNYSRLHQVRHYWKPAGAEDPAVQPFVWQDFGYFYTYDSRSYLTALTDSLGRPWWDAPEYDYMDRVISVRKGADLTTTRTYRDTDGVLTALNNGVQNWSFGFDGLGNLTSRSDGLVSGGETLTYDNLNRLKTSKQGTMYYDGNGNITNKPDVSGNPSTLDFTYDPNNRPHAVTSAFGYSITYDGNGNMLTRQQSGDQSAATWTGFDKPRTLWRVKSGVTAGSEFHYNARRSRVMQLEFDGVSGTFPAQTPSHYNRKRIYAMGSTLELNYKNSAGTGATPVWGLDTVRIYVPGPDGIIGAREFHPASSPAETAEVYHYDHLGSITATTQYGQSAYATDGNGKPGKFSEDAWGQRRNPVTWTGAPDPTATDDGHADSVTPRGFTGHEMLDDLGLVHMNGRIYDPLLGRFLSADIVVSNPSSLQSYNRYSYCANNPLFTTDSTGFETEAEKKAREDKEKQEEADRQAHNRAVERWISGGGAPELVDDVVTSKAESVQTTGTPATDRATSAQPKTKIRDSVKSNTSPKAEADDEEGKSIVISVTPEFAEGLRLYADALTAYALVMTDPGPFSSSEEEFSAITPAIKPAVEAIETAETVEEVVVPAVSAARVASPNATMRANANILGTFLNPVTNQVEKAAGKLAADHIVPQDWIKQLPGFNKLTSQQKNWVLNHPLNTQGLPKTFNSSKGPKMPGEWTTYKGQSLNPQYIEDQSFTAAFLRGFFRGYVKTMSEN